MFKVPFVKIFVSPLSFCSYDVDSKNKHKFTSSLSLWFLVLSCDLPQGDSHGRSLS